MNKTVLITGATSGIGLATARIFAAHQYDLILTGRREDRLAAIKAELLQHHKISVTTLCFDIRNKEACQLALLPFLPPVAELQQEDEGKMAEALGDKAEKSNLGKGIDILVNNAGLARGFDYVHEADIEHWEEMIDTNIKGLLYVTQFVTPHMIERKSGHIINLCSTAGKEVYPKGSVYCATKFAVDALTKAMRLEFYTHGLRVSQVSPAHVEETEFARVRFDWDLERASIYKDFNPLTSRDVAEAIYFIASRPPHVNVQDIVLMGTQQAGNMMIDRTGRKYDVQ